VGGFSHSGFRVIFFGWSARGFIPCSLLGRENGALFVGSGDFGKGGGEGLGPEAGLPGVLRSALLRGETHSSAGSGPLGLCYRHGEVGWVWSLGREVARGRRGADRRGVI